MKTEHTPGPWKVCEHSWSDTSVLAEGFDHGICSLDINHATEESQEADEAVMAANARLIAAAPDLLEIARQVVEGYDELDFDLQSVAREAKRAIAKATGDQA